MHTIQSHEILLVKVHGGYPQGNTMSQLEKIMTWGCHIDVEACLITMEAELVI